MFVLVLGFSGMYVMILFIWGVWFRFLFGRRFCSLYLLSKGCSFCLGGSWLYCGRKVERFYIIGLVFRLWVSCFMGYWEFRSSY